HVPLDGVDARGVEALHLLVQAPGIGVEHGGNDPGAPHLAVASAGGSAGASAGSLSWTCFADSLCSWRVFQSARNCSRPLSVSGCWTSILNTLKGIVAMSAPTRA